MSPLLASASSSTMSGLTSEQQQRIEENRKRAKERLARKRPLQSFPSQQTFYNLKTPRGPATAHDKAGTSASERTKTNRQALGKWRTSRQSASALKDNPTRPNGKKCLLTLQSKSRFQAVSQYDAALIELFKKISSKSYGNASSGIYTWLSSLLYIYSYLFNYFIFWKLYAKHVY